MSASLAIALAAKVLLSTNASFIMSRDLLVDGGVIGATYVAIGSEASLIQHHRTGVPMNSHGMELG